MGGAGSGQAQRKAKWPKTRIAVLLAIFLTTQRAGLIAFARPPIAVDST